MVGLPFPGVGQAQNKNFDETSNSLTFADYASLSDASELVIHAEIRKQIRLKDERAPGLPAGFARLYIEARTIALVSGNVPIGESLSYLVDVPLNAKGKPAKLKNSQVIVFARYSDNNSNQVQLVGSHGQIPYSPHVLERVRPILSELTQQDAPSKVTGVRDALSVTGNLAGESETQIFLKTVDSSPISITVLRRPGQNPTWGVSWGEIIDRSARQPRANTLKWYRLACSLPPSLPSGANLSRNRTERMQAERDYRLVMGSLGPCDRTLPVN